MLYVSHGERIKLFVTVPSTRESTTPMAMTYGVGTSRSRRVVGCSREEVRHGHDVEPEATFVLYLDRGGSADIRVYNSSGMLRESLSLSGVRHVRLDVDKCSLDISFAEYDVAIVLRVSGRVSYKSVSNVLEVRCVGSQGKS